MACAKSTERNHIPWQTEDYLTQKKNHWPTEGKHILAQYDEDTIVVYQAFNPEIAAYAVKHQRFGGIQYQFNRMSWIKTNFLWMMYRCGWCSKKNQERVLAVRITKEGFNKILANAYSASFQKSAKISTKHITVRLQWDPDHSPRLGNMNRRAIQLGLKGKTLERYATEWVVQIEDITDFVKEQRAILLKHAKGADEHITVARERVYTEVDPNTAAKIQLDHYSGGGKSSVEGALNNQQMSHCPVLTEQVPVVAASSCENDIPVSTHSSDECMDVIGASQKQDKEEPADLSVELENIEAIADTNVFNVLEGIENDD